MQKYAKIRCINCGQLGHTRKICKEPKTSYGIIAIKINNLNNLEEFMQLKNNLCEMDDDKKQKNNNSVYMKILKNIAEYLHNQNSINETQVIINNECNSLQKFSIIKRIVKVLLIMRKHTLGYMEFIRGHYNINNIHQLKNLFQQMTPNEIDLISKNLNNFDYLWKYLWSITESPKINEQQLLNYKNDRSATSHDTISNSSSISSNSQKKKIFIDNHEYIQSKINFEKLCNESIIKLSDIIRITKSHYDFPEWGFPKGRRTGNETDLDCAKREFTEETGYTDKDYILFDNIQPLVENITGFDGRRYKHVYYIALLTSDRNPTCDYLKKSQLSEIGDINLFDLDQSLMVIRTHHVDRRYILYKLFSGIIKNVIDIV